MDPTIRRGGLTITLTCSLTVLWGAVAAAHAPMVSRDEPSTPSQAVVLDDPTLSRALGATIGRPGEVDWYRMDLRAGDPIVLGMTAPDAAGALATTFVLVGPGLPDAASVSDWAASLAAEAGAPGAVAFSPATEPAREIHGGLGFLQYGTLRLDAPTDGTYHVAVFASDAQGTGKYVFAPGVREEFGADAIGGMADLIAFFNEPWPPATPAAADGPATTPTPDASPGA
jgi:hypothetical protein